MKRRVVYLVFAVVLSSVVSFAQDVQSGHGGPEPPMAGIQWAKDHVPDQHARTGGASSSPNLIYHGGPIMNTAAVTAIFWGQGWNNATFMGDKVTGLDSFYGGVGGSNYALTNSEYNNTSGLSVSGTVTYNGHIFDFSSAPANGSRTSPILAEVCKIIPNPVSNGFYPVYVDTRRGHAGFCAWHSAGSCNGTPVQFAFFFNLDGDPGCDPGDTSGLHSQGLAALANVSGHELSEALTDPRLNAWYDSGGAENSDKCAWAFGPTSIPFSSTSTRWKIQGNWSNSAYNTTTRGYTNLSGQKGCIDGGTYN